MKPREVLDRATTPDGAVLELALEHGSYILRVGPVPLMSSEMRGSEEAMAAVAFEEVGARFEAPRILVGGLGMGFTLRAVLDRFGPAARVCVAELLPAIIGYNRGVLADLAGRPLEDPRVEIFEGDVCDAMRRQPWEVLLFDVDNGPNPLTARTNRALYGTSGVERMARALVPGGVLVVWSAYPSPGFAERLRSTGLSARVQTVRGRWPARKGPTHTLFIAAR